MFRIGYFGDGRRGRPRKWLDNARVDFAGLTRTATIRTCLTGVDGEKILRSRSKNIYCHDIYIFVINFEILWFFHRILFWSTFRNPSTTFRNPPTTFRTLFKQIHKSVEMFMKFSSISQNFCEFSLIFDVFLLISRSVEGTILYCFWFLICDLNIFSCK